MNPKDFKNEKTGQLLKGTQGYWAFVPDPHKERNPKIFLLGDPGAGPEP